MQRPEFPRQFVSPNEPLSDWAGIEPYFAKLQHCDIDTPERIKAFLPDLEEMIGEGLVTLEKVQVIVYRPNAE